MWSEPNSIKTHRLPTYQFMINGEDNMKKFLITLPFLTSCKTTGNKIITSQGAPKTESETVPVDTSFLELSIFDPTNLMLWLSLCSIAGYFVWREFRKVRPKSL